MKKKEMKFYEAPAMEVVEMEVSAPLLEGSGSVWDQDYPTDER